MSRSLESLAPVAALAATAGMRSMTAPAALARSAVKRGKAPASGALALGAVAVAELVADKLPQIPDRISPLPVAGRALSGAVVGAIAADSIGRSRTEGALVGAAVAVAATALTYHLRRLLRERTSVPDRLLGGAEDLLAMGLAGWATASLRRRARG